VEKDFVLNYDGRNNKVGSLELEVTANSIAATTKITRVGEKWFKMTKF